MQEQVSAALTMARLRQKAVDKFGDAAAKLFFTDDALQQASHPLVRKVSGAGLSQVGVCWMSAVVSVRIVLAFAAAGATVHGLDIDPVRIAIAQHNAAVIGVNATFSVADVTQGIPDGYDLIFFDPARRDANGKRIYDVEQYIPPLSLIENWNALEIIVKLAPGVDVGQIVKYGGEVQFISVKGDMKEAVLNRGAMQSGLTAVLLTDTETFFWRRMSEVQHVDIADPQGWLCEPDPSILRASLVQDVTAFYDGTMLDETIAYFTTGKKLESVWLKTWQIQDWMPFNLKKLRAYLRERNIGNVTVKKRGSPITPEELIRKLKLKGDGTCTLVLTQLRGEPIVMVCENIV